MFVLEGLESSALATSKCDGAVVLDGVAYAARLRGGFAMMFLMRGFELLLVLMLVKVSGKWQTKRKTTR